MLNVSEHTQAIRTNTGVDVESLDVPADTLVNIRSLLGGEVRSAKYVERYGDGETADCLLILGDGGTLIFRPDGRGYDNPYVVIEAFPG